MTTLNEYYVDITIRVKAEDPESAWYLANERATLAFAEKLEHVSEPEEIEPDEAGVG